MEKVTIKLEGLSVEVAQKVLSLVKREKSKIKSLAKDGGDPKGSGGNG